MRSTESFRTAVTAVVAAVAMTAGSLAVARPSRAAAAVSRATTAPTRTPAKPGRVTTTHRAASRVPYRSLEVRVHTRDRQTLGGTLTLPAGAGKHPAVLVLTTADTSDRDGTGVHGFYRPYRQIADTLSRNGIAVLRLDDRGVGTSTGRLDTLNTEERAGDARDALAFLRARPDIDARRVGIVGHSEGATIAEMIAAGDTALHALVVMGSPAYLGLQTWEWRERRGLKSAPYSPAVREKLFQSALIQWQARIAKDRWAKFFDAYDPLVAARRIRAPILILQGDEDLACPPASADVLAGAIRDAGNGDVTVQHLVGVDHAFLRVRDFEHGVAYGEGAYRLSSDVLGRIVAWVVPHLK